MSEKTETAKLEVVYNKIINLKPKGSMISQSELNNTNYHVITFYSRVRQVGNSWEFMGYEAVEKHKLGYCKHCEIK